MTVHPSALLRIPEDAERRRAFAELVRDLRLVKRAMRQQTSTHHEPGLHL